MTFRLFKCAVLSKFFWAHCMCCMGNDFKRVDEKDKATVVSSKAVSFFQQSACIFVFVCSPDNEG